MYGIGWVKQVITSRAFLEKAKLEIEPFEEAGLEIIYLEDVGESISVSASCWRC